MSELQNLRPVGDKGQYFVRTIIAQNTVNKRLAGKKSEVLWLVVLNRQDRKEMRRKNFFVRRLKNIS